MDLSKPFRIHVDACRKGRGIGAVLLQQADHNGGRWQPVAYWSLKLTETERNYSATDLECKGLHDAIEHWSVYLKNSPSFEVVTDHYALVYLITKPIRDANGRLMRYIMDIQNYRFSLIHRKGGAHLDADAVSRLLRYDDEMLRILDRDRLVEEGVVTTKDVSELEQDGKQIPYPGIDRATKEDMLNDLELHRNRWGPEEQKLISTISLRHAMEQLLAREDDPLDFLADLEQAGTDENGVLNNIIIASTRITYGKVSQKLFDGEQEASRVTRVADSDVIFNDDPAALWDPFKEVEKEAQLREGIPERVKWPLSFGNTYRNINDCPISHILDRCDREPRDEFEREMLEEYGSEIVLKNEGILDHIKPILEEELELHELVTSNTSINGTVSSDVSCKFRLIRMLSRVVEKRGEQEVEKLRIMAFNVQKEYVRKKRRKKIVQVASEYKDSSSGKIVDTIQPKEIERSSCIEDTKVSSDVNYGLEEDSIQRLIDKYSYLEDKLYVDNENGRLYSVTEVYWDSKYSKLCTYRVVRDGLPPNELDEYPYIVVGGDPESDIVTLVESWIFREGGGDDGD